MQLTLDRDVLPPDRGVDAEESLRKEKEEEKGFKNLHFALSHL